MRNYAATQAIVLTIENDKLTWRDSTLGRVERNPEAIGIGIDTTMLQGLPVSNSHTTSHRQLR